MLPAAKPRSCAATGLGVPFRLKVLRIQANTRTGAFLAHAWLDSTRQASNFSCSAGWSLVAIKNTVTVHRLSE